MKVIIEKELYGSLNHPENVYLSYNFESKNDPKKIIGDCKIIENNEEKRYEAEITFLNTPFSKQVQDMMRTGKYYPAIAGKILEREGEKITKAELTGVSICPIPNVDPTIPPIQL